MPTCLQIYDCQDLIAQRAENVEMERSVTVLIAVKTVCLTWIIGYANLWIYSIDLSMNEFRFRKKDSLRLVNVGSLYTAGRGIMCSVNLSYICLCKNDAIEVIVTDIKLNFSANFCDRYVVLGSYLYLQNRFLIGNLVTINWHNISWCIF